jgi:hypothetical protein
MEMLSNLGGTCCQPPHPLNPNEGLPPPTPPTFILQMNCIQTYDC